MNKKGTILVVLMMLSLASVFANAETNDDVISIVFAPQSDYVEMGELYVDINDTTIVNDQVFTSEDEIYFSFDYDVAYTNLFGTFEAFGGGVQLVNWYYDAQNTDGTYNETRMYGAWNVYLDEYDLGLSNMDPASGVTNQTIQLELEEGWHFLTVIAAELVSDDTHETFEWQWVKDSIRFYVSDSKNKAPKIREGATVAVEATATPSEDLDNPYAYEFLSLRPSAEPVNYSQIFGSYTEDMVLEVNYNTSDFDELEFTTALDYYGYYPGFAAPDKSGSCDVAWFANDGDLVPGETGEVTLYKIDYNYVYFATIGYTVSTNYGFGLGAYPTVQFGSVMFKIQGAGGIGPTFGIFISVSIFGLVAALSLRRFRK